MKSNRAEDSFSMYSGEVDKHKPLSSADEQKALFLQMINAQGTDSYIRIRNGIMERSLRLVIRQAKRIRRRYPDLPFGDMVQAGNLGLLKAVEKFDPDKGKMFSTYAMWWIRSFIHENCMNTTGAMRVPIDIYKARKKIAETVRNGENGGSDADLAERTGLSVEIVGTVREVGARHMIQLDEIRPGHDGHESTLHAFVPDERRSSPEARAIARVDCVRLLRPLPEKTQHAIVRNALFGNSIRELADDFDVTRQAVSARIIKGIGKIKGSQNSNLILE